MPMYNGNMENGFNKFKPTFKIHNERFRNINNKLKNVNTYALPALGVASLVQPELSPVFGGIASGLKASEEFTGLLKNTNI
jgi:hypothetical protein